MKKEYIIFGVIGIALGMIPGFIVANMTYKNPVAGQQPAASASQGSASVNSGQTQELPPNHPPIDSGQTIPAPPLPNTPATGETPSASGAPTSGAPTSGAATGETAELPSLDPLPASSKEKRVEQEKKNIQVLKGLPADRLTPIMFAFKTALGVDCTYCHIKDQWDKDDKPAKQIARKMIGITRDANAKLGSAGRITCYTCHRGQPRPPQ
jgi:Photosynthetic reaction centre cytochrome C subunit